MVLARIGRRRSQIREANWRAASMRRGKSIHRCSGRTVHFSLREVFRMIEWSRNIVRVPNRTRTAARRQVVLRHAAASSRMLAVLPCRPHSPSTVPRLAGGPVPLIVPQMYMTSANAYSGGPDEERCTNSALNSSTVSFCARLQRTQRACRRAGSSKTRTANNDGTSK